MRPLAPVNAPVHPRGLTRELLGNAAVSAVAAVALGIAATGTVADVFAVFGVWAGLTDAAQLVVVFRRRALLGNQWPLVLANGVSVIGGIAFVSAAVAADDPEVRMLAIYAATGGVEFVHPGLAARAAPSPPGHAFGSGPERRLTRPDRPAPARVIGAAQDAL